MSPCRAGKECCSLKVTLPASEEREKVDLYGWAGTPFFEKLRLVCSVDAYRKLGREGGGPNTHTHTHNFMTTFSCPALSYKFHFITCDQVQVLHLQQERHESGLCCHGASSERHCSCSPVYLIKTAPARLLHREVTSFALLITISGKGSCMPWRYYRFGFRLPRQKEYWNKASCKNILVS